MIRMGSDGYNDKSYNTDDNEDEDDYLWWLMTMEIMPTMKILWSPSIFSTLTANNFGFSLQICTQPILFRKKQTFPCQYLRNFLFETLSCQTQWIGTVGLTLWLKLIMMIMIMMAMRKCYWSEFSLTKLQIIDHDDSSALLVWYTDLELELVWLILWRGIGTYKTPNGINRCGSYLLQLQPFLSITATAILLIGFRDRLYFAKVANRRNQCLWFFLQKKKEK